MTTVGEQPEQNTRHHPGFEAAEGRPKATSVGKPRLDGNGERPTATSAEPQVGDIGTDDAVIVADQPEGRRLIPGPYPAPPALAYPWSESPTPPRLVVDE